MAWLRRKPKIDEKLLAELMDRVVAGAKAEAAERYQQGQDEFLDGFAVALSYGEAGTAFEIGDDERLPPIIADGAALNLEPDDQVRFITEVTKTYLNAFMLSVMELSDGAFGTLMDDLTASKANVEQMFGASRTDAEKRETTVNVWRQSRTFGIHLAEIPFVPPSG